MSIFLEKKYQSTQSEHIVYSDIITDDLQALTEKPVLVFLHGLGGDLSVFNSFRKFFAAQGYRSLAIDFRGHGFSAKSKQRSFYDFDLFVADILGIIKSEKISNYVLVGHCLGGLIAQKVAIKNPEGLSGLVLINSTAVTYPLFKRIGFSKFVVFLAIVLEKILPTTAIKTRADHTRYVSSGDFHIPRIIGDILHTSAASYGQIVSYVLSYNVLQQVTMVTTPTLIISGKNDLIFPAKWSELLHEKIKNSQLKLYERGNHLFLFAMVEEVSNDILAFLKAKNVS